MGTWEHTQLDNNRAKLKRIKINGHRLQIGGVRTLSQVSHRLRLADSRGVKNDSRLVPFLPLFIFWLATHEKGWNCQAIFLQISASFDQYRVKPLQSFSVGLLALRIHCYFSKRKWLTLDSRFCFEFFWLNLTRDSVVQLSVTRDSIVENTATHDSSHFRMPVSHDSNDSWLRSASRDDSRLAR